MFVIAALVGNSSLASVHADSKYSLDTFERTTKATGKLRCPQLPMTKHRGGDVRYHKPVYVYVDFKVQLEKMETIVERVAKEVYGRSPRRIKHLGTYNCRRIRRYPGLLSEHALGNAIDIEGFDFAPAKSEVERAMSPKRSLRRGFQVRIERHWHGSKGSAAIHARFLRLLTKQLIEEDVFRVLLGPSYPGHQDHLHFDLAPYRLVEL